MISNTDLFNITTEKDFNSLALEIFSYQYKTNKVYNRWCNLIGRKNVTNVEQIPFLPISFFRTHDITCFDSNKKEDYFISSGTTNIQRSVHNVLSKQAYIDNTINCFEQFYNDVSTYCYICLLPNYLEQQHSSLICMMDAFIKRSIYGQSGFFKENLQDVIQVMEYNESRGIKTMLWGVTYALLDLIELKKFTLTNTIVFETGGMKGKRKEITKKELHSILKEGFGVKAIASEYGMCELFSQAYASADGQFKSPKQMQISIKSINDYNGKKLINHNGIINIIDLANINTCSFIQTEDIGIQNTDGTFEITGRLDHSALRGCNLMYTF
ncbi:MAG: LuxE/PaaK family acyltransferase [Bacteroidales bacterium]